MKIKDAITTIESLTADRCKGLPEDIFLFVSRITPLVNVDLLIKNEQNQTLMTWRDDEYYEPGWHIPGGIIRFKETFEDRIKAVAKNELGTEIRVDANPLAINEVIHPVRETRGHFISLLFKCLLITPLCEEQRYKVGKPKANEWKWHSTCPPDIIAIHEMYKKFV